jgi:hypothetical protein
MSIGVIQGINGKAVETRALGTRSNEGELGLPPQAI